MGQNNTRKKRHLQVNKYRRMVERSAVASIQPKINTEIRKRNKIKHTAILSTGGVLLYLPHHLDLASEDSVGHTTCMSVLARRRAIMGSIVQPKRSCLGLSRCCHVLVIVHAGASQGYVLGIPLYPTGRSST